MTRSPIDDDSKGDRERRILLSLLEDQKAAMDALQASQIRLRTIFDTEPECVKLLAADGSLLEMNTAGLRMLEADTFAQIANHCVYPLVVAEHRPAFEKLVAEVFRGQPGTGQFQITGLKGGRRWMETHAAPLRDAAGKVTALLGVTRDITERKQSEATIASQTRALERIARGAPLAEIFNSLLRDLEALSPGMLCSFLKLDPDGAHLRHLAAPSLPEAYTRAIDGEAIGERAGSCGAAAFRRAPVIVEDIATDPLWADYRALALAHDLRACWSTPIFDDRQAVLGTFAIYYRQPGRPTAQHRKFIDIATGLASIALGREHNLTALRVSENRFRQLTELTSDFAYSLRVQPDGRPEGEWLTDSFGRVFGYSLPEIIARGGVLSLAHPDDRAVTQAHLQRVLAGQTDVCEMRFVTRAGESRWLRDYARPVWDDTAKHATHIIGAAQDITERKQGEHKLAESKEQLRALLARLQRTQEEERTRVAREIHDELGQLLTGLKMDVRWLERKLSEPGLPPAFNSLLDRAVGASELADATIAVVQKIAAELRPGALDHLGLEVALTREARRFQDRSGLPCTVTAAANWSVPSVQIANELFRICQEALTNVLRHARATRVAISLRVEGSDLVLEVDDDGVGMAQAELSASRSLGLLGMRERAALCGGTVAFEPNPPRGTRVTVRVPVELHG